MAESVETFTCPDCGATSAHPDDVRFGYCGRCHDFKGDDEQRRRWAALMVDRPTRVAPPDGYAYFDFVGGTNDGEQRLIKTPIDVGFGYELMGTGERYELLDDQRFHLMPSAT